MHNSSLENIETTKNAEEVEMEKKLYVAAAKGNVEFLQEIQHGDRYLLNKTYLKNSIIHIAVQHEQHEFVEACLSKLPNDGNELICEKNSKENTPLHVAAEVGNFSIVKLLYDHFGDEKRMLWRGQNSKGNTPLHVALVHDNVKIAKFLLEKDPSLACIVNKSKEAPLHLAIKHHVNYSESESIMDKIKQPITEGGAGLAITFVPGEDMSSLILFLVEKWSNVTCWPDANGSTPLHSAASLSSPYNLQVIKNILYHWPQSAEVCDASGKSILHLVITRMPNYQQVKNLLKFKEIYALRNCQDLQGDTPLHIAARNKDINMVRVLLESSAKLSIKNVEGVSAASLIQQHNLLEMLGKRNMTLEESKAADKGDIAFLRQRMRKLGMENLDIMEFLLSHDSKGRNILHKLLQIKNESHIMHDDFVDFIQQVLGNFPSLVSQTDLNGDTPVHILVQNHPYVASGNQDNLDMPHTDVPITLSTSDFLSLLLELCHQSILRFEEQTPWLVQNAEGNTPLHEAIVANNKHLVRSLLMHDPRSARLANKCKELPLHLLAGCPMSMDEPLTIEIIESMVEAIQANDTATDWVDKDGLTPLMRAFKAGNLRMAAELCILSPQAAQTCDADGQTFWHRLMDHPASSEDFVCRLLEHESVRDLLKLKDKHGNTPLHLAIEGNRYDLVGSFLVWGRERISSEDNEQWLLDLLKIQNKACKTPADLIRESPSLPPNIERIIKANNGMIGVRSAWGIPTKEMQTPDKKGHVSCIYDLGHICNVLINDDFILSPLDHGHEQQKKVRDDTRFQRANAASIIMCNSFDIPGRSVRNNFRRGTLDRYCHFGYGYFGIEQFKREDIKAIVEANVQAAYSLDKKGLTPLIRAGNYSAAAILCKASPKAAESGDANCQAYGHLIVKHPSKYYFSRLFHQEEFRDLLKLKDINGNTPLHLAIIDNRFDLVPDFLQF
uniref:Uncharacterized protein n=1 Tax=Chenopodium quinoa TaxID=63459 RepID=A0A803KQH6_CHEQI